MIKIFDACLPSLTEEACFKKVNENFWNVNELEELERIHNQQILHV